MKFAFSKDAKYLLSEQEGGFLEELKLSKSLLRWLYQCRVKR